MYVAQVRQNRTAERLFSYGFEVRTQHQLGSVLHENLFLELAYEAPFCQCVLKCVLQRVLEWCLQRVLEWCLQQTGQSEKSNRESLESESLSLSSMTSSRLRRKSARLWSASSFGFVGFDSAGAAFWTFFSFDRSKLRISSRSGFPDDTGGFRSSSPTHRLLRSVFLIVLNTSVP